MTSHHSFNSVRGLSIYWYLPWILKLWPRSLLPFLAIFPHLHSFIFLLLMQKVVFFLDTPWFHLCWLSFKLLCHANLNCKPLLSLGLTWLLWPFLLPSFSMNCICLHQPTLGSYYAFFFLYIGKLCVCGGAYVCIMCLCSLVFLLFKPL